MIVSPILFQGQAVCRESYTTTEREKTLLQQTTQENMGGPPRRPHQLGLQDGFMSCNLEDVEHKERDDDSTGTEEPVLRHGS